MDFICEITGGIGKHIMFTSFIKWLNEQSKSKISVISAYPEIFEYNPRIYRNLRLDQPYLFEDYIKGKDFRRGNPYELVEYYRDKNKKHINELFPKAYLFNKTNKNPEMEIYLTKGEEIDGQVFCKQNFPLITIQNTGGMPPGMTPGRMKVDSSQRDMPQKMMQYMVNILVNKGFKVLQLRGKHEPILQGTIQLELPFRNLLPIIKHSVGHIGIDSSFMHATAVFKKPMLIFWGGTHVDNLGYKYEGAINVYNPKSMHGRPYFAVHDRSSIFPFKDKNEGFEFDYSEKEIESKVLNFLESLNKIGGQNVTSKKTIL